MSHKSEAEWAFKSENVGDWKFRILVQIVFKMTRVTRQVFKISWSVPIFVREFI